MELRRDDVFDRLEPVSATVTDRQIVWHSCCYETYTSPQNFRDVFDQNGEQAKMPESIARRAQCIQFTMEVATNDRLPFIGMEIIKIDGSLETCFYRKKTNEGLLLHYQSHVDSRYKRSLLRTMLDRAKRLSSTQDFLLQECKNLKCI